ncbi:MAG: DUF3492 domain-containing protein [Nevskiaceae bacterium]|nr:MAG: DUF3492 domain-containing protein [Nevskiaceae bacterium]TBR74711.1 MAG: DUF3492 domain-containing protein [Nevskiaceae bacterium]
MNGDATVDVTLLLEGTYPYIRGGVSSWIHQMIRGLPELRFAVIFIGGQKRDYGAMQYRFPPNVVRFEERFLMEAWRTADAGTERGNPHAFVASDALHAGFKTNNATQAAAAFSTAADLLGKPGGLTRRSFLYSRESWQQICDYYGRYCRDPSFVDYFWTVRTMHAPLFDLVDIARHMPETRLVHAVSTGYAGHLGALAHELRGFPLLLTEHGIYTKERRIDLAQAGWIHDADNTYAGTLQRDIGYTRELWIRFFEGLGRVTYRAASVVTALYEGNSLQQQRDGAPPERCRVVPNGIDIERFHAVRVPRERTVPPVLGLIGRVVSIKDIKNFIRAMPAVCSALPKAEGWIVGPDDEDPSYAAECRALVSNLQLEGRVKFLGFQKTEEILPQLGLVVLSSISEAQPLVLLEGFAAGIPAVSTAVGCCSELIFGATDEDRALGAAGATVPIANPQALARAMTGLLVDPEAWRHAHDAAVARVERFYSEDLMFQRYRDLYREVGGMPGLPQTAAKER